MRAIPRTEFGGPEVLVIREMPEPEPLDGHAVIEVKAFGLNHAELHVRKGEWAEIADVSGLECVGIVKSCPGGEFAPGTKVAALMGRLGRTRGYYGSVSQNVKATYGHHLGWFDGNLATLNALTPVDSSKKHVEFMGGAEAVLSKGRKSYAKGEYRWVAQVVNHVVFADPDNKAARELQADALEQLG